MGLPRDRAIGHRPGGKTPHDRLRRFDLLQRHRKAAIFRRLLDAEETADRQGPVGLIVQKGGIGAIARLVIAAHGVLQEGHRLRRPGMRFAADAEGVIAANIERVAIERRIAERLPMAADGFLRDLGKAGAADPCHGPGEIAIDERPPRAQPRRRSARRNRTDRSKCPFST